MMKSNEQGKSQALSATRARDWRKAMSDHVAYGLLVYTALQIFVTVKALSEGSSTALPYLALIVLVAGIIPVCRWFEKRWAVLSDAEASDPEYSGAFRRDVLALWSLAIGLPFGLTLIFISHNLSVVRHVSDRILVLYLGRIVELADTRAVFSAPTWPFP